MRSLWRCWEPPTGGSHRCGGSYDPGVVEPEALAPDFELPDQDGRAVRLTDFRGAPVVLHFYPKADTKGA